MQYDVIIPTYNRASLVIEAVESICSQSLPPKTIIVVDDGSNDGTPLLLDEYLRSSELNFKILRQDNLGVSRARNNGVEHSVSKFIAFLDDDDIWLPNTGYSFIKAFEESDADVITGYFRRVDMENGTSDPEALWNGIENIKRVLADKNVIGTSWTMLKNDQFKKVGGFDESLTHCEDWDLFIKLALSGASFFQIPETLALYREPYGARLMHNQDALDEGKVHIQNKYQMTLLE